MALSNVPATKPSATLLDSAAAWAPLTAWCALSVGSTATAENHSARPSISHTASTTRLRALPDPPADRSSEDKSTPIAMKPREPARLLPAHPLLQIGGIQNAAARPNTL
jgi:hypothetical protein